VRLITRAGNDFSSRFPFIAMAVSKLPVRSCLIDGEAIVTHAIDQADELFFALRCGADDDQQALRIVLQPCLDINSVGPKVDVPFGR
jgi:hypothetical protein